MDNSKKRILLVDDEPDILEILSYNLKSVGYKVNTASNGEEAIKKANKKKPDLIILDVMMPKMDGIEVCAKLRETPGLENTLIVFLSARAEDYSQLAGFSAGADDYIVKPVKPKILLSKINALLRRNNIQQKTSSEEDIIQEGNLIIDRNSYEVTIDGNTINLPRKEFELLAMLVSNKGRVFKRDEILENIWGNDVVVGGRTIDVHIRKLREKIGDNNIQTIKGVGYKYI